MALNIYPRSKTTTEPAPEPEATLPEPSPEALAEVEADADADAEKKRTRRGTRGGRGRSSASKAAAEQEEVIGEAESAKPARTPRTTRSRAAATTETPEAEASEPAPTTSRRRSSARDKADDESAEAKPERALRGVMRGPVDPSLVQISRAIEAQTRQIEQLVKMQEDLAKQLPAANGSARARVGVFVDVANVELGLERLRTRINWGRVLESVTRGRDLVRAIAYCPVHDDPSVSIETQRFVEPFLDRGYKIVTKPLKRFADGSVKANVDIELAMDVITMVDRLDIVVLASGDGDFQRLVEVLQGRGIRVEVLAVGSSTAGSLRHAADEFIDIGSRLKEFRLN